MNEFIARKGLISKGLLTSEDQIKLSTGSTYSEGEIRYTDNHLWVNTGGTVNDWAELSSYGELPDIGDNYNIIYRDSGNTYGYNAVDNFTLLPDITGVSFGTGHTIMGNYSSILGGKSNISSSCYSLIVGGSSNSNYSCYSFIGGGYNNSNCTSIYSSIVGGRSNNNCYSRDSFIGGGCSNSNSYNSFYSSIVGGYSNSNCYNSYSSIVGGSSNSNCYYSYYSFIGGGNSNSNYHSSCSFIGGGNSNSNHYSSYSSIVGGNSNSNYCSNYSSIDGGCGNCSHMSEYSWIGAGCSNTNVSYSCYSSISGGYSNSNSNYSCYSSIVGGRNNSNNYSSYSFIGGGRSNSNCDDYSFIGGGSYNNNCSNYSSIIFGSGNTTSSDYSFIGNGICNRANSYMTSVFGRYNVGTGTTDSWVSTDSLFEIGNGTSDSNRSNALTVYKNGYVDIKGKLTVGEQVEIWSGTTNEEGEIRYKDNALWVNTGGTTNDWVVLLLNSVPSSPTNLSLTEVGDTVQISFDEGETGCESYEVWMSESGNTDYSLISIINKDDISSTMSVVDSTYVYKTTLYYKIYAIKNGKYSSSLDGNIALSNSVGDVTGLYTVERGDSYFLSWKNPEDRRLDKVQIKVDKQTSSGSLSESNATLVYEGLIDQYEYEVSQTDVNKYFQFWVYTVTKTI